MKKKAPKTKSSSRSSKDQGHLLLGQVVDQGIRRALRIVMAGKATRVPVVLVHRDKRGITLTVMGDAMFDRLMKRKGSAS